MKHLMAAVLLAAAASTGLGIAAAAAPRPTISAHRAERVAARKLHGKALSSKYEFEDGRWQYAVIVMKGAQRYEVEVSAKTGKVLDTEKTSVAEEEKEAAAEKK
ncbi:MAG: PepSY domain-containing protein [Armatimonadota bacterium]|nr:PepSY domain-containing protein [Armatimonadota bacterium]